MNLRQPFEGKPRITDDFTDHNARKPPSSAPGIDFALPSMTRIRAPADGAVWRARFSAKGGRSLWIQHAEGIRTYYAHLECLCVLPGEQVKAGQLVAFSGSTGASTGPHLHFSVKRDKAWIDPADLLKRNPQKGKDQDP